MTEIIYSGDTLSFCWSYYYYLSLSSESSFECIMEDYDKNIVACGQTNLYSMDNDILVVKLNNNGSEIWNKRFGYYYSADSATHILPLQDGCYVLTGIYYNKLFLMKIDENGDLCWLKSYNYGHPGHYISVNNNDGFIIASSKIIYTDSVGDIIWEFVFPYDVCRSIYQLENQNYLLAGNQTMIIINEDGDIIWQSNKVDNIDIYSAIENSQGNFVVTGDSSFKIQLVCISPQDSIIWKYDFGRRYFAYKVIENSRNEYIVVGNFQMDNGFIAKYDSIGNQIWCEIFGIFPYIIQKTKSLGLCSNGDLIICGNYATYKLSKKPTAYVKRYSNIITGVAENNQNMILDFRIIDSFNPVIEFTIDAPCQCKLKVYDIQGRLISKPINDFYSKGNYSINLSIENPGVYFYHLQIGIYQKTGKILVLD